MAANIPAKLKSADISRFATRASQLEKVKPVISYWCNYWIVNQILSRGLHNSDEDCLKYTTALMDKLEKFKTENSDNDAVTDDVTGQAYVEQFALETFQRADNTVNANKASLQTADTFQAAATFLELSQIWGQLDQEHAAKVKFAKYHALRIAKAVKAGEDPNLSNPKPQEETELEGLEGSPPALDSNDPEVQALHNSNPETQTQGQPQPRPRQASVEEIPDENDRIQHSLAQQSSLDESLHPSRASSTGPQRRPAPTSVPSNELPDPPVLTGRSMDLDADPRQRPSNLSQAFVPDLPAAPSDFPPGSPASTPDVGTPSHHLGGPPDSFPSLSSFQSFPPPAGPTRGNTQQQTHDSQRPLTPHLYDKPEPGPTASSSLAQAAMRARAQALSPQQPAHSNQNLDENSIAQAQKHARWAVSALNFDDVNTAVKELRTALGYLGAQ